MSDIARGDVPISVSIPVIQFVERAVDREVGHLKELHELRFKLEEKARELNHVETLRRLEELNHAHAQNRIDKQDYVLRQSFDQYTTDNAKWRQDVTETISSSAGANRMLITVVGIVLTVITIAMRFWK